MIFKKLVLAEKWCTVHNLINWNVLHCI